MGGKNTPDVPSANDYMRIAKTQAGLGKELVEGQTRSNRPDQFTPWGSSTWEDMGEGKWAQTIGLPDTEQEALESQQRVGRGRSQLAESLLGRAEDEFGNPIQWEAMEANELGPSGEYYGQEGADALYGRATSRLDPMWEQREQQTHDKLWNQGLRPGDAAWDTAMGNLAKDRNDAYQTAQREASMFGGAEGERMFGMDFKRRQQAIAEELQRRGTSLNEINAILTGQQVSTPGMPTVPRAGTSSPPDLMGAARSGAEGEMMRYNAGNMQNQGIYAGISDLASAGAALWPLFNFSDRRLKTNVVHVGHTLGRQPVYRYTIFNRTALGVMADESPPHAVVEHPSGYLMVDYSRIV